MKIKIDLMIGLFLFLFTLTSQLEIYVVLMIFALIHELGHLCVGLLLGYKLTEIKVNPLGAKMEMKEQYNKEDMVLKNKNTNIKRAFIAIAGPTTNFLLICSTIILTSIIPELEKINIFNINYESVIYANLLIGIFNLIPIYPLDGGRAIKEILYIIFGFKRSYKYTYLISKTTIVVLTVAASIGILFIHNISILIIILYLWGIVIGEEKKSNIKLLLNYCK